MTTFEAKINDLDAEITSIQTKYDGTNPEAFADTKAVLGVVNRQISNRHSTELKNFMASVRKRHTPDVAADIKKVADLFLDCFLVTAENMLAAKQEPVNAPL